MRIDKFTLKAQEAVQEGQSLARRGNHPNYEPEHLLKALLAQTDGVVVPMLQKIGTDIRLVTSRVDDALARFPSVQGGTRTVDITLDEALPRGAVPDLSIDGTIELERLDNVLFIGRPVLGQEHARISLFRVEPDGARAERVTVALGRSSVEAFEVLGGLREGDRVILSDMSAWDGVDRIRLQ